MPTLEAEPEATTNKLELKDGFLILPDPKREGKIKVDRFFSTAEVHPYDQIEWSRTDLVLKSWEDGSIRFQRDQVEHPAHWDYTSVLVTADKYLFGSAVGSPEFEDSLRQAFDRIANTYTVWAWEEGYIADLESLQIFNEELKYLIVNQIWAPNSPVWFNIGHWEQWRWGRPDLREIFRGKGGEAFTTDNDERIKAIKTTPMEHPQCSACFLTEVNDSMESILDHIKTEGRIFSNGSGVGINLSSLRSSHEPITGKGKSSGPLSFDRGFDRMAGSIKSGGKTRRAARMVLLYSDHPNIFDFIKAKNEQEEIGKIVLREHNVRVGLDKLAGKAKTSAEKLAATVLNSIPKVNETVYSKGMDALLYGETLGHQNANHSVSLKGDFWKAYRAGEDYQTRWVSNPEIVQETFAASKLLDEMAQAAHDNAEPGVHMNDWINLWNPVKSDGEISTSNPCSEYLHLNNTSCNLASFNAYRFRDEEKGIDAAKLDQACFLSMMCADLNIQRGGFPIKEIAEGTRKYRTTGIGFTNIGGLLMSLGIPYDTNDGRYLAGQLVSMLTASCWKASAQIGEAMGAYHAFDRTGNDLRQVLNLHRGAHEILCQMGADGDPHEVYEKFAFDQLPEAQGLNGHDAFKALENSFSGDPVSDRVVHIARGLSESASQNWKEVTEARAYRNSFVSVLAPTGTISAPLGALTAGTTSGEPDYSLIKNKVLSGGGSLRMFNSLALQGLGFLGYSPEQVREAALEVAGIDGLIVACEDPATAKAHLMMKPQFEAGPVRIAVMDAISGDAALSPEDLLGFQGRNYDPALPESHRLIAGGMEHVESIPWLNKEHLAVFDCATTAGEGKRSIAASGHLRMLGAVQPFLSGSMSKTVNLPYTATVDEVRRCFVECHELGVKCIALFRSDSKAISVYSTDTPEGRKWSPDRIWKSLVSSCEEQLQAEVQHYSKPQRRKLPGRRMSQTVKFEIGGQQEGFVTVSTYPDGRCGEIFLRIGQGGTFISGALDAFAKAISMQLQYGVPLDEVIESFSGMAFDPSGFCRVGDDGDDEVTSEIRSASSTIDLVMKILDWLFPAENGRALRGLNAFGAWQEELNLPSTPETLTISNGDVPPPTEPPVKKLRGGSICPKCGQATYVQDGKCKRCTNPSCGYKDGGCGE
ncbi:MAG: ribonucleoside-diphosphate reductase, adenosylcobalamin-dependent [Verrucomicrobiota bacterium]